MNSLTSATKTLERNWRQNPKTTVLTVVGVSILIVFLTWLIIRMVDSGSRINVVTNGVISLAQPTTIDGERMPQFSNGTEYGISMWIYVNEPPRTVDMSPILSIGNVSIFEFDQSRSNINVKFPAFAAHDDTRTRERGPDASFDHISLKRWVHVMAVHVDGTVTLFKDGELYSVNRLGHVDVTNPVGSIRLGGRPTDAYVSSVVFMNHFPSDTHVKRLYRNGPQTTNGLFRLMGFNNIGVRSPVYRLTE